MARRKPGTAPAAPVAIVNESILMRRRRALQRALLEGVALDSPLGRRHAARLAKAGPTLEARVRAYEQSVAEAGLTWRAEELLR